MWASGSVDKVPFLQPPLLWCAVNTLCHHAHTSHVTPHLNRRASTHVWPCVTEIFCSVLPVRNSYFRRCQELILLTLSEVHMWKWLSAAWRTCEPCIHWKLMFSRSSSAQSAVCRGLLLRDQFSTCRPKLVEARGTGKYHVGVDIITAIVTTPETGAVLVWAVK